ncbi:uncharacterized protein LOC112183806 [Rosa chinensis]|uniref:uncharacterized protein LOC112183806 n=1 Tax=Rosa chinensis TaxID=74649 RepID=UPI000D08EA7C|nr:uncharacterized protein LOC112183806 [Rosa chinensis]
MAEKEVYDLIGTLEIVNEELSNPEEEEEDIQLAPAALDDTPPKVRDPTENVNLGTKDEPMEVAISAYLEPSEKERLIDLLREFKDCFAEKYEDIPSLSTDLVCHQLPTHPDKRPVKQELRRMNSETQVLVKEEVKKMHKSGIIRVAKYNKWLFNIVPVRKKNGKIRVCVDYRDLNVATPKDVYPMSVADMLVDAIAGHELLSFMDGTAGYHQILVAEEDRHKTAFRCPGFARFFEYVSKKRGEHIIDLRKVFERLQLHKLKMNPAKCVFGVQAGDFLGFIIHQRGIEVPEDKANAVINASPPRMKKELQRLLAAEASIGSLLAQDDEAGVEHDIFYLSRTLTDCETRYTLMERLCLTLYFSACKKAVKGQAIADFLAHHPMLDIPTVRDLEVTSAIVARPDLACLPEYAMLYQATLEFQCTNNQAKYEALIIGLEVLLELGVRDIQVRGDSLLVINQLRAKYRCGFGVYSSKGNFTANELAQLATAITLKYGVRERILKVERRTLPSWLARPDPPDEPTVAALDPIDVDWRIPLIAYFTQSNPTADRKTHFLALNYFLRGDELRRRGEDDIDFRCVYGREVKRLMREVHEGVCGAHQAGPKMRWLIRRHGYYWPSILKDCIAFAKDCPDFQAHGPV